MLTPADINASGATDIASALNTLLPSLNFPRPAINDGNDAVRPLTLRGLSPDDVLVLVDGKRYHTNSLVNYNNSIGRGSAPVDFNSIPISAIDHIEVLRDGAARRNTARTPSPAWSTSSSSAAVRQATMKSPPMAASWTRATARKTGCLDRSAFP